MKTFKQFLMEEEYPGLKEMIERDCKPFLTQSGRDGFLYRGMKEKFKTERIFAQHPDDDEHVIEVTVKTAREQRQPSDTPLEYHETLDKWFDRNVGFKARSQGVFCYGVRGKVGASSYGKLFIIFPIGDFDYAWSEEVQDLYGQLEGKNWFKYGDPDKALDDYLEDMDYKTSKLPAALQSKSEIMIKCSKYYAISAEYADQLHKILDVPT